MTAYAFSNPASRVVYRLENRNQKAQELIDIYAKKHIVMDVGIGLIGMFPGATIPALMAAIAAQVPIIYQPLAKNLTKVYLATPDELDYVIDDMVPNVTIETTALDIAAEFGVDFLQHIAGELLTEMGIGVGLSFIPFVGGIAGAALDYTIAKKMTNRLGKMISIYFQNNGQWRGTKSNTYETAKNMNGSLNDIRRDMPDVSEALLKNIRPMVKMMHGGGMSTDQIRTALRSQGIPDDLIALAIKTV